MTMATDETQEPAVWNPQRGILRARTQVAATVLARLLIEQSAWFECTPEPDDLWLFETKGEIDSTLRREAARVLTEMKGLES